MIQHIKTVALVALIAGVSLSKAYAAEGGCHRASHAIHQDVTAGL
ncbi:hypothetical protein [Phaeobacter sp. B1627]|nr:hypothetical protein [Phaeobacter sp. B1627]